MWKSGKIQEKLVDEKVREIHENLSKSNVIVLQMS